MEELIKEIRGRVTKCELSRRKENTNNIDKKILDGMITAYNNILFEIELNKEYYINEVLKNINKPQNSIFQLNTELKDKKQILN